MSTSRTLDLLLDQMSNLSSLRITGLFRYSQATQLLQHFLEKLATALPNLEELGLSGCTFNENSMALFGQTTLPRLARLDLSYNRLESEQIETLVETQAFPSLQKLCLHNNFFSSCGVEALVRSFHWTSLTELNLAETEMDCRGLICLSEWPLLSLLTSLDLRTNHIGPEGVRAFAQTQFLPNLKILRLNRNRPGSVGLGALFNSPNLPGLTQLDLADTELTNEGFLTLAQSNGGLSNLERLDLQYNHRLNLSELSIDFPSLVALCTLDLPLGGGEVDGSKIFCRACHAFPKLSCVKL